MNDSYLLIEILDNIIFYVVRHKELNIKNILDQKKTTHLSISGNEFREYSKVLLTNVKLIMQKHGYEASKTRVYLHCELKNCIDINKRRQLRDDFYIATGVNLNFLSYEQEEFYKKNQPFVDDNSVICGIAQQELRSVVLCGSFRKYLSKVNDVYRFCEENGIEVLSPKNLSLKDMFNDSFALFHGECITDERETYLIESKHTEAIKKADAIIVCNPDGYIGSRTLYEIGYADSQNKRIIFLYNECRDFDICFPRDYGLIGFDL